jgi:hydroxymethylbilane synthase
MEELRRRVSGLTLDVHVIKTTGDRMQDVSLAQIGGKGAFVKELEEALLERRIDVAIHSGFPRGPGSARGRCGGARS